MFLGHFNVPRMPKLPHCRHDTARAKRVDGDGGIKAAIWGGALAARHACVGGCVCAATIVYCPVCADLLFCFRLAAPFLVFSAGAEDELFPKRCHLKIILNASYLVSFLAKGNNPS